MPGTPADAEATTQDPGIALLMQRSGSAAEPDAATKHIAPASLRSTGEASPGSGDMAIKSLADGASKLDSECQQCAVFLCSAARTLRQLLSEIGRLQQTVAELQSERANLAEFGTRPGASEHGVIEARVSR